MKKLLIISTAPLIAKADAYAAYSPYVSELEIWTKYVDEVHFCCPVWHNDRELLHKTLPFQINKIVPLQEFSIQKKRYLWHAITSVCKNFVSIYKSCKAADHIHLRCPGNIGLLGCMVQIFFPNKKKSAKYAGNWDPNSKQPLSYRLQKWILSNTFLTKNMKVLVYGEWPNQSRNIKSFFTASYKENQKRVVTRTSTDRLQLIFVGTLSTGKRPLYAIQIANLLLKNGIDVQLDIYGEGAERQNLEEFIALHQLENYVLLHGNQPAAKLIDAYADAHFLLLPSQSEGWPKAAAEAMFWGCIPVSTNVSCVSYMLDHGNRGLLLSMNLHKDVAAIEEIINVPQKYQLLSANAMQWSQEFTLEKFENEIKLLLEEDM